MDMGNFYRVPADKRNLNYDIYMTEGEEGRSLLSGFNSANARLLSVADVREKLLALPYIQHELARGETPTT